MSYDFLFSTSKFYLQKAYNFHVFTMWILESYEHICLKAFDTCIYYESLLMLNLITKYW
jgi:hypothetical protein